MPVHSGGAPAPTTDAGAPDGTRRRRSVWQDSLGAASIRAAQVLLLLVLVVIAAYALTRVTLVVIPLLLALILAAAISPLVNWLRRKGWPSAGATAAAFVLLLVVIGGILTGIVFAIIGQAGELVDQAEQGFTQVQDFVQTGPFPIDNEQIDSARESLVQFATSSSVGAGAVSGLTAAGNFFAGAALLVVILFFFLKDGDRIWAFVLRAFRGKRLVKARQVGEKGLAVLGGYVRGTAIIAFVDAFFIGLALVILGIPLAVPLAALIFVGAFIPIVGASLTAILAALVALVSNGLTAALIVVAVIIVVNQLEGNFLQPVVMGRTLQVHALVVLLALTAGTVLAGIIGAILSVPIAAVTWAAIKAWNQKDDADITEADIDLAERETALDEQGHGVHSLPPAEAERLLSLASGTSERERPMTASRAIETVGRGRNRRRKDGGASATVKSEEQD
ncbi:AI-2E family transporter [Arthrobacter sp. RIT-PI-e]|uniref:AI-2E family transporter n=1 Tax=Arthrobacter sp. RIT-PI-e TaxID=1681197 RepID=UPI0009E22C7C|nr:AI-2E family transporter [Arthrobacter sp. RIT-PI-e]